MSGFPKVILVFLTVDWQLFMRRKMLEALAESVLKFDSKVIAVNRPLCPLSTVIRKPHRTTELFARATLQQITQNLFLYSPRYFIHDSVAERSQLLEEMNLWALRRSYANLCRRIPVAESNPVVWFYDSQQAYVTKLFPDSFNVYEIYDNLADFHGRPNAKGEAIVPNIAKRTNLLVTTSRRLHEKYSPMFRHSYRFGNGIDRETYKRLTAEQTQVAPAIDAIPRPRLGYTGLVSGRLDWKLVLRIADLRPDWHLIFVGKVFERSTDLISSARSRSNIHFLGHFEHATMPSVLEGFDVGIMPYNDNDFFRYSNPLKIYEYAAAGLPTVSSNMEELSDYPRELVRIARNTPDDWIYGISEYLKVNRTHVKRVGAEFAGKFIWQDMTDRLSEEIERLIRA